MLCSSTTTSKIAFAVVVIAYDIFKMAGHIYTYMYILFKKSRRYRIPTLVSVFTQYMLRNITVALLAQVD